MKTLFSSLIIALLGLYAFFCSSNPMSIENVPVSGGTADCIVISDNPAGVAAISPIVHYSVPDKLRNKRRAASKPQSTLVSSLVLCALSAIFAVLFYKSFLSDIVLVRRALCGNFACEISPSFLRQRIFALLI